MKHLYRFTSHRLLFSKLHVRSQDVFTHKNLDIMIGSQDDVESVVPLKTGPWICTQLRRNKRECVADFQVGTCCFDFGGFFFSLFISISLFHINLTHSSHPSSSLLDARWKASPFPKKTQTNLRKKNRWTRFIALSLNTMTSLQLLKLQDKKWKRRRSIKQVFFVYLLPPPNPP